MKKQNERPREFNRQISWAENFGEALVITGKLYF